MRTTASFLIVGLLLLVVAVPAAGQNTINVDLESSIRPVKFSAVASGELLGTFTSGEDPFIIGQQPNGTPLASIYVLENRAVDFVVNPPKITSTFNERIQIPLRDVDFGDAAIADMDGNGEMDIIYSGRTLFDITPEGNTFGEFTGIYYNFSVVSEEPTFQLDEGTGIPAVSHSRLAVADFDGDSDLDVVIGGNLDANSDGNYVLAVYMNSPETPGRFEVSQSLEDGIRPTTIAAGDYDGDGDQDFVVGGSLADGSPAVRLYSNDGSGTFTIQTGALPNLYFPAADFGDLDGDGDDELLLTGGVPGPTLVRGVSTLYEYDSGSLAPMPGVDLPGLFYGGVEFGDLEGDGDLDFFMHGLTDPGEPLGQHLYVFRNDLGSIQRLSDVRSVVMGGAAWIDYDGNGTREILVVGERTDEHRVIIYEFL